MKIPWWVWALGLGGVGYILYKSYSGVSTAAATTTNAVSTGIADIWLSLPYFGVGSNIQVLGSVQMPDGSLVPLSSLAQGKIRTDASNNVYANINGNLYQLSPSNAQGNYPATLIGAAPAGS